MLSQKLQPVKGQAKYIQVRDLMYNHLASGQVRPGEKLWTEWDLVKSLGVSITTVRKATDELVRAGLVEQRVGKGTFFKQQTQAAAASSQVLMLSPQSWAGLMRDGYYGQILRSLDDTVSAAGLQVIVATRPWGEQQTDELHQLETSRPGCMIFPYSNDTHKQYLLRLAALGIPLLLLSSLLPEFNGPHIYFDHARSGQLAADHLLQRGHRRFGLIGGPTVSPGNMTRVQRFVEVIQQHGGRISPHHTTYGAYGERFGHQCADRWLSQDQPMPTAVFCSSDYLAFGLIKRCEQAGLRIPDDLAVIGVGDYERSSLYYPRLTTIAMNGQRMGYLAGQWARHVMGLEAPDWPASPPANTPSRHAAGQTAAPRHDWVKLSVELLQGDTT